MIQCPVDGRHAELHINACVCGFRLSSAWTPIPEIRNIEGPSEPEIEVKIDHPRLREQGEITFEANWAVECALCFRPAHEQKNGQWLCEEHAGWSDDLIKRLTLLKAWVYLDHAASPEESRAILAALRYLVDIADPGHPLLCAMRLAAWRLEDELRKAGTARNLARSRYTRHLEHLDRKPPAYLAAATYYDRCDGQSQERAAILTAWGK